MKKTMRKMMTKRVTLIAVVKVMKKNRRNPMLLQVDVLRQQVSSKRIKKFLPLQIN